MRRAKQPAEVVAGGGRHGIGGVSLFPLEEVAASSIFTIESISKLVLNQR